MREIKFRAWHKNAKYMCNNATTDLLDREWLEFMQYTGLKDKNGKEIYEGDIIKHHVGAINKVWYKNGAFVLSYKNSNINLLHDLLIIDGVLPYWKVIGNIYENEDLLHNI